jgi:hypothetical protein
MKRKELSQQYSEAKEKKGNMNKSDDEREMTREVIN